METPVCPYPALSPFPRAPASAQVLALEFGASREPRRRICGAPFMVLIVATDKTLGRQLNAPISLRRNSRSFIRRFFLVRARYEKKAYGNSREQGAPYYSS
jgi:hypothetical protein